MSVQREPAPKPSTEQEELLGWFKEQVLQQQEHRRSKFSSTLAEQSAAFAQAQPQLLATR